jgi:hypothetical protein
MTLRGDSFWADFLGMDPTSWSTSGVSVHAHVGLRGYRGLWCFRRKHRIVVSAPAPWLARAACSSDWSDAGLDEAGLWRHAAAVRIALSLGYDRYANHLAIRLSREAPEP